MDLAGRGRLAARALRRARCFRDLAEPDLLDVAYHASERAFQPGEALFEQGEAASRFFLVTEGRLKVTMIMPEGKQVLIRLVGPGDFCGLTPALARPDYPATCRGVVAGRAYSWPLSYWATLIGAHPQLTVAITEALGRHIEEVHSRMAELATAEVERRVAHAVLRLAHRAGLPSAGEVRIDFPVTGQDIAEMTGTTLHSVSRIVSAWSSRGIIRRGRARIVICDLTALEGIAQGEGG